jgi:GNAT superfamily N-acetyltransferase
VEDPSGDARPALYARNAAAMWASLAPWSRVAPGTPPGLSVIRVPSRSLTRVILRQAFTADPGYLGPLLAGGTQPGRVVIEDSFGELGLPRGDGITVMRMPVMIKRAGPVTTPARRPGIRVVEATTPGTLAQAERVIVEGFPQPAHQPFRPGQFLPPLVLTTEGWRIWLAYNDGEPAAVCCTFDDGVTAGVYWVATQPAHRSLGLGRAVMIAALSASAHQPAALVATSAGEPLYTSLGFRTVSTAVWYRRQAD